MAEVVEAHLAHTRPLDRRLEALPHLRGVEGSAGLGVAEEFEADHLLREPLDYLAETGFEIEELMRSKWGSREINGTQTGMTDPFRKLHQASN